MFVNELVRLGADVRIDGHHAVVRGRERLSSAPVVATDIRAGAGLVLAGLVSDGVTEVQEVHHVDRGYPDFVDAAARASGREVERTERPLALVLTPAARERSRASVRARSASSGKTSTSARCGAGNRIVERMPASESTARSARAASRCGQRGHRG